MLLRWKWRVSFEPRYRAKNISKCFQLPRKRNESEQLCNSAASGVATGAKKAEEEEDLGLLDGRLKIIFISRVYATRDDPANVLLKEILRIYRRDADRTAGER